MNKKYVITGGPSVGKTTLINELEKLGHITIPEAARVIIDQGIKQGLTIEQIRNDEKQFQINVLNMKLQIEKSIGSKQVTFLDRGLHDTIAYLKLHYDEVENEIIEKIQDTKYAKVFILDPLPAYDTDYARIESATMAKTIHDLIYQTYVDYGMRPIRVPVLEPAKRAEWLLRHINETTTLDR